MKNECRTHTAEIIERTMPYGELIIATLPNNLLIKLVMFSGYRLPSDARVLAPGPGVVHPGIQKITWRAEQMAAQYGTAMEPLKGNSVPVRTEGSIEEFNKLYESIARRAYELFENSGRWFGRDWDDWFRAEAELVHPMHLNLSETDDKLVVRAEVPGFSANEIDIILEPRFLRITGKRESKEEKSSKVMSESCCEHILRMIDLPQDVDASKANASLKDGILTIELPKSASGKSVSIKPKAA